MAKLTAQDRAFCGVRTGEFRLTLQGVRILDRLERTRPPIQIRAIKRELRDVPVKSRLTYLRALVGGSPAAAMATMCLACAKWGRGKVKRCVNYACPLWGYRRFKSEAEGGSG